MHRCYIPLGLFLHIHLRARIPNRHLCPTPGRLTLLSVTVSAQMQEMEMVRGRVYELERNANIIKAR